MKGIYLTEAAKKDIEARIAELKQESTLLSVDDEYGNGAHNATFHIYKEILSSAIIIPVEEDYNAIANTCWKINEVSAFSYLEKHYPNGVIIQPDKNG